MAVYFDLTYSFMNLPFNIEYWGLCRERNSMLWKIESNRMRVHLNSTLSIWLEKEEEFGGTPSYLERLDGMNLPISRIYISCERYKKPLKEESLLFRSKIQSPLSSVIFKKEVSHLTLSVTTFDEAINSNFLCKKFDDISSDVFDGQTDGKVFGNIIKFMLDNQNMLPIGLRLINSDGFSLEKNSLSYLNVVWGDDEGNELLGLGLIVGRNGFSPIIKHSGMFVSHLRFSTCSKFSIKTFQKAIALVKHFDLRQKFLIFPLTILVCYIQMLSSDIRKGENPYVPKISKSFRNVVLKNPDYFEKLHFPLIFGLKPFLGSVDLVDYKFFSVPFIFECLNYRVKARTPLSFSMCKFLRNYRKLIECGKEICGIRNYEYVISSFRNIYVINVK